MPGSFLQPPVAGALRDVERLPGHLFGSGQVTVTQADPGRRVEALDLAVRLTRGPGPVDLGARQAQHAVVVAAAEGGAYLVGEAPGQQPGHSCQERVRLLDLAVVE
jgi:hypothetical protein